MNTLMTDHMIREEGARQYSKANELAIEKYKEIIDEI